MLDDNINKLAHQQETNNNSNIDNLSKPQSVTNEAATPKIQNDNNSNIDNLTKPQSVTNEVATP